MDRPRCFPVPMADLRSDTRTRCWRCAGDPVHARGGHLRSLERVAGPHGHGVRRRIDADDVEGNRGGESQTLALADGEAVDPLVTADDGALHIADDSLAAQDP